MTSTVAKKSDVITLKVLRKMGKQKMVFLKKFFSVPASQSFWFISIFYSLFICI